MSITDERDEVIDFLDNYTPPDPSAFVGASEGVDLAGGVVAAQTGTIQAGYIAESGATLVEFATPEETIAAVKNGEADAVLADKSYLAPIVAEDGDLMFVGDDVPLGGGVGMGIRESDGELKAKFDAAIKSMKDDGSLNEMITKWEVSSTFE
jgi:polar amino acid transport system substrate-binding protein